MYSRVLEFLEVLSRKVEDFKLENKIEIEPTLIPLIVNDCNLLYVLIDKGY